MAVPLATPGEGEAPAERAEGVVPHRWNFGLPPYPLLSQRIPSPLRGDGKEGDAGSDRRTPGSVDWPPSAVCRQPPSGFGLPSSVLSLPSRISYVVIQDDAIGQRVALAGEDQTLIEVGVDQGVVLLHLDFSLD
jgi:hypothetical protein